MLPSFLRHVDKPEPTHTPQTAAAIPPLILLFLPPFDASYRLLCIVCLCCCVVWCVALRNMCDGSRPCPLPSRLRCFMRASWIRRRKHLATDPTDTRGHASSSATTLPRQDRGEGGMCLWSQGYPHMHRSQPHHSHHLTASSRLLPFPPPILWQISVSATMMEKLTLAVVSLCLSNACLPVTVPLSPLPFPHCTLIPKESEKIGRAHV